MNKSFILIFIFLSSSLYGQRSMVSLYQHKMDSIAISHLNLKLNLSDKKKNPLVTLKPIKRVKITMKTRLNFNVINKIKTEDGLDNAFDELSSDDYMSLGSYDIRSKIYLNKDIRLLCRIVVTGVQRHNYFYSGGLFIRF